MMAVNRTKWNNPGTVEDVSHRVNRIMDGIRRIIRIIITLWIIITISQLEFELIVFFNPELHLLVTVQTTIGGIGDIVPKERLNIIFLFYIY